MLDCCPTYMKENSENLLPWFHFCPVHEKVLK